MPLRTVPGTDIGYWLVCFDENGEERVEKDGAVLSTTMLGKAADGVTDIFVASHGWKGDIPAAIDQYDAWFATMAAQSHDRQRIRQQVPDFKALVVGVHWPSLPWGNEELDSALLGEGDTDLAAEEALPVEELVDRYAPRIDDSPTTRAALTTILRAAEDPQTDAELEAGTLPHEVRAAYETLFAQAGLGLEGALGPPGADQATFDPVLTIEEWEGADPARDDDGLTLGFGDDLWDRLAKAKRALLSPVRQLSFWTMKKRARTVGENGVHELLRALQEAAPGARLHLMGHSFGCIVVSAAVAGAAGGGLPRPVDAMLLVQGAMSLWSYAAMVPFPPNAAGYFRPLLESPGRIHGPVVTTRSSFDTAVGKYYPLGARIGGDLLLGDELPEFGGIGAYGIQGAEASDLTVLPATDDYDFAAGGIYNVDAATVICNGTGASGAHSDIAHPEIAHLMWQATSASLPSR